MEEKFLFLPEVNTNCNNLQKDDTKSNGKYPCPCCGYNTLPVPKEEAIAYICPVCFWENDVFISSDDEPSDENHGMTLNECRKNYKTFGACSKDMLIHTRKPKIEEYPK